MVSVGGWSTLIGPVTSMVEDHILHGGKLAEAPPAPTHQFDKSDIKMSAVPKNLEIALLISDTSNRLAQLDTARIRPRGFGGEGEQTPKPLNSPLFSVLFKG